MAHFELAAKSPWTGWPQLPGTDDVEHFGGDPNAKRSRGGMHAYRHITYTYTHASQSLALTASLLEFIKLVVSKLICLYQELKGEDSVQRLLDLLEWQFEDCPELLEQFNMLEMSEHYFREYKETDRFAKWIRRLPTLGTHRTRTQRTIHRTDVCIAMQTDRYKHSHVHVRTTPDASVKARLGVRRAT